jgi:hypothetical protein
LGGFPLKYFTYTGHRILKVGAAGSSKTYLHQNHITFQVAIIFMNETTYRVLVEKPKRNRPPRRPRQNWGIIKWILKETG